MQALIFDGSLSLEEVPVPTPGAGEVLIKILCSSICNTDLEIIKGYMGFKGILGHEFVGEVVTTGSRFYKKRVVGEINCPCGTCYLCRTGRQTHCSNRSVLGIQDRGGVFAEYITLPEANLHEVPSGVPSELAVFTEPLAAAIEIFEQVHIRPSQSIFIFGAGKLGILISLVFRLNGCEATTFDITPSKVMKATSIGLQAAPLSALGEDEKAEVCIDCTGHSAGVSTALKHLFPRGRLILKTTVSQSEKIDLNQIVINEFQITGSRCGPFAPALRMLSNKLIDPSPLISDTFPLTRITDAFVMAAEPDTLKVIVKH